MDYFVSQAVLLSFVFVIVALAYRSNRKLVADENLPPAPPSFPIIGHLHLLKPTVHRIFYELSQRYGPVFSFRFGSHPAVIVSSLSVAEECFTNNDVVLADRPRFSIIAKHLTYNFSTISSAPYGDHWRNMRRIGAIEIFSSHRLNVFTKVRHDEVRRLLEKLSRDSRGSFVKVELKSLVSDMTFNNILRMVAGRRYYGDEDDTCVGEAKEFKNLIRSVIAKAGVSHVEDFLPVVRWIKGGRFEREIKSLARKTDSFLQTLVDEHRRKENKDSETADTMIDHLLSLQETQPEYYNDDIIKGLILIMLMAGTDTSAVTMEWAMSYLVNNPDVLEKARDEVDAVIGEKRLVSETDIANLRYLQGVITETLRVQPAAPLLVPHYSSEECIIGGYKVPRHTMVVVNAWAIHRDPEIWEDPERFEPERFVGEDKQQGQLVMPFGLGRRACPGSGLALRVMGLSLASLIQCFEWRRLGDKLVDMTEGSGTVVSKAEPLEVECRARNIVNTFFPLE